MNLLLALLAGVLLGWLTFSVMDMNGARGKILSMVIGALGAIMGSKLLTPFFAGGGTPTGDFSALALLCAIATAAAVLFTSHMIHARWDI